MNILFATPDLLGYGGIQYSNRLALQALRESFGTSANVYALSRMDRTATLAKAVGVPCYGAGGNRLKMAGKLLELMNSRRWDVVLLMHVNLATLLPLCLRQPPVLAMLYGIDAWRPLSRSIRWGLQRATKLVSISHHTRRRAEVFNPWMGELPHDVCHLGIETSVDSSAGTPPEEDSPYVLSIGRMVAEERYKGFDELIKIWPLVERIRPDLKLFLMGDGPDRPRLEAVAERVGSDVRFLGRVDDVTRDRYLKHCTAFCLPSRSEGFGLVYLEAMRLGRPVLTGSGDAGSEVITDGITGRGVDPTKPGDLLNGLLDVTGPRAAEFGEAGRERFFDQFTYLHFRDRFTAQVREVLEGRRVRYEDLSHCAE